ncbi:MAG: thioesterase family protein [Verrucomicrobiota bacterium]
MSSPEIEVPIEVMFFDTDVGGVVHNIAYLRMIEVARTKIAGRLGFNLREMAETQVYPVVVRTEIDYLKPARLGDTILVRGKVTEAKRARFWCEFELVSTSDGARFVSCRQSLALVQMPEGKVLRLPDGFGA